MKTHTITTLAIAFLFCACTKSAIEPVAYQTPTEPAKTTNTTLQSTYLVKNLGMTSLTIKIIPVITCYSYGINEAPRPCTITLETTCELSKPINAAVRIEIKKLNDAGIKKAGTGTVASALETGSVVMVTLAPNATRMVFTSTTNNSANSNVSDMFTLGRVSIYTPIN